MQDKMKEILIKLGLYYKIKFFIKRFDFIKTYNSPFKAIIPKIYIGKIAVGVPYFFPRKLVRLTEQEAINATLNELKNNPNAEKIGFEKLYYDYSRRGKFIDKKIGFDFVGLGWKTKWKDTDYRHEWNPVWSFVFIKWQVAIKFTPIEDSHYWECWLYYTRNTDKTKSTKERIIQARKEFPCVWIRYNNGEEERICFWDAILKNKWYGE
jgi:hypothetical protein